MDFRPLKHFLMLADSLHFGRASEACHVSPSTLSRSIRQLEQQLGVVLFNRDNRHVVLTPQGKRFQRYAKEALEEWEQVRLSLQSEAKRLSGEISIYCSVTASYSFLYSLLADFRQRYPAIELKLHTGDPARAIQRVLAGDEDMAITSRPRRLPDGLAFKSLTRSALVFIAPQEQRPWVPQQPMSPSQTQWQGVPMILSEAGLSRELADTWFKALGVTPTIYAQVAGHEAIVSMVGLGFGIGVVPRIVLEASPLAERVRILPVKPELPHYDVGLCVLERRLKSPLIDALWQEVVER
ncbi:MULTISPECIES: HTH-type transcriptional activator IlvY [Halomonas]|uniref:HTH-type transcriptional activator IlvY n=3 Tax=Halomonas TaxID=2745 RepID=A0AAU7KG17_9GAMM|nr:MULTISPECIES: HTH-type transcriptional activator IlvY [Halomonas]MBR9773226.1 HTH-type transcriptional activator IlvY [Gammaproteobacteria bacterium]KJZ07512.1 transcriptional regulator [Halomonas sp. S2151]MBR9881212.1 HTH-type transcriptional activator IlvY [Gammaproteobacteria bacterium]MBS8270544.1 HTH-type transcriptional activator IlvY [Halomonas litopenaei]MBY5942442.1 HTH-type transcriptional activator IlvY [Halomonas sp. DP5N14-9]|tara:strand:- start:839 stop:1726 length:888 start_codon:yes stop_codon:yes gene_type:complete